MARVRNQHISSNDPEVLVRLAEEFTFLGREVKLNLDERKLTVFALPLTYKKKRRLENKRKRAKQKNSYEDYLPKGDDLVGV